MKTRQGEPAVRLIGVRVANEKIRYIRGLFLRLLAEAALASFQGFGNRNVAMAGTHIGARERQQAQNEYGKATRRAHRFYDYNERNGDCLPCDALSDNKDVPQAITKDPETMHGVPVFRGTRVPVQTLFDYLAGGQTLEDFLEGFPTVSRGLVLEALEEAKQLLLARA
jgi:uncharacterized protein (DUF433 family)